MATQRKEYFKYQAGLYSPIINAKRIYRLERIGFTWLGERYVAIGMQVSGELLSKLCQDFALKEGMGFTS